MKKHFLLLAILLTFGISGAFAQTASTPEKGSPVRKAILDSLRTPVEKEMKQKIVFVANNFKVQGAWAFMSGTLQNSSGGEPDFKRTKYKGAMDEGAFDNNIQALFKKTGSKWKIVTYDIGCTDVCYAGWWKQYKAPKAIFPYTE